MTARQKEAEASAKSDFLAADKHKTEAMDKRKASLPQSQPVLPLYTPVSFVQL